MRRWGYGLAGLLAIALFAGIANPEEPASVEQSSASGPQATQETSAPVESEATTENTSSSPDSDPSPRQSSTETSEPAAEESSAPEARPEATQAAEPPAVEAEEVESSPTPISTPTPTSTPTQTAAAPEPQTSGLAALLAQLEIEEEFPSGYDRDLFRHWIDADRDGCDARREVLIVEAVVSPVVGERCSLTGGSWYSAFDGVTITNASEVDMDHMVPLKEAWDSGAHAWSEERRRAFANDIDLPEALIGVSRSSNRSKGADDPAEWLPPLASYHCQYVRDWMVVKIKWELSVDAREFNALRSVAAGC